MLMSVDLVSVHRVSVDVVSSAMGLLRLVGSL